MEVGNGLAQPVGNVGEHRLEMAEGLAREIGVFGIDEFVGIGVLDEDGDAPVGLAVGPVALAGLAAGEEGQDLAVDVGIAGQLAADVRRGAVDVVLQEVDVPEDGVVDALEDVVVRSVGDDEQGVVDETVAERLDLKDIPLDIKVF